MGSGYHKAKVAPGLNDPKQEPCRSYREKFFTYCPSTLLRVLAWGSRVTVKSLLFSYLVSPIRL